MIEPQILIICGSAFAFSFALTVAIEKFCNHIGLFDEPGPRKIHKRPVPRMGGLSFVLTPIIAGFFVDFHLAPSFIVGALLVFTGGALDDLRKIQSAVAKLAFQIPAACLFAAFAPLDFLNVSVPGTWALRFILAAYVLFMVNAANLMDNMNGLAAGLSILWLAGLAYISHLGSLPFTPGILIITAALLGFFIRNYPWGKIYMGDQGSQVLGYAMACVSVLVIPHAIQGNSLMITKVSIISIFLFSAIFFFDVLTVCIIRLKEHRPLWHGDQCHLSHQLVRRGVSPTVSTLLLSCLQSVLVILACWGARILTGI